MTYLRTTLQPLEYIIFEVQVEDGIWEIYVSHFTSISEYEGKISEMSCDQPNSNVFVVGIACVQPIEFNIITGSGWF